MPAFLKRLSFIKRVDTQKIRACLKKHFGRFHKAMAVSIRFDRGGKLNVFPDKVAKGFRLEVKSLLGDF